MNEGVDGWRVVWSSANCGGWVWRAFFHNAVFSVQACSKTHLGVRGLFLCLFCPFAGFRHGCKAHILMHGEVYSKPRSGRNLLAPCILPPSWCCKEPGPPISYLLPKYYHAPGLQAWHISCWSADKNNSIAKEPLLSVQGLFGALLLLTVKGIELQEVWERKSLKSHPVTRQLFLFFIPSSRSCPRAHIDFSGLCSTVSAFSG